VRGGWSGGAYVGGRVVHFVGWLVGWLVGWIVHRVSSLKGSVLCYGVIVMIVWSNVILLTDSRQATCVLIVLSLYLVALDDVALVEDLHGVDLARVPLPHQKHLQAGREGGREGGRKEGRKEGKSVESDDFMLRFLCFWHRECYQ
jgi:hypothetical protein